MHRLLFALALLLPFCAHAENIQYGPPAAGGGSAPCNAFGTTAGKCAPGNDTRFDTTYNPALLANGSDETSTLNAAITACQALVANNSGGCNIVIPNGTVGISSPLAIGASAVSLTCGGAPFGGFAFNEEHGTNADYPCRIKWIGSASTTPFYMLTIQPTVDPTRRVIGNNLQGVEFDCNRVVGCGGLLILSEYNATMNISVSNPAPAPYVTNNSSVAGTQVLHFASATGVDTGQIVTGLNILSGTYVVSISGGDVTISTTIQVGDVANGATIGFGGEGVRFDVSNNGQVHPNDTQQIHIYFVGQNFAGAVNLTAPLFVMGGSSQVVSTGHFGNTSSNFAHVINCLTNNGACVVLNNTDHDIFEHLTNFRVGAGSGECLVGNGGPGNDAGNGGARFHFFRGLFCGLGAINFRGTDSGGFVSAAFDNKITWSSTQFPFPTLGAGATTCVNADNSYTWRDCNPVGQFGTEADGDRTCAGAITATGDLNYRNFTANAGCALNLSGFRMFVSGLLDLTAAPAGSITCNLANPGHAAAAGAGGTTGAVSAGRISTIATGTAGGAGGTGGAATGGTGQTVGVTNASAYGYGGDGGAGGTGGTSGVTSRSGGTGAVASIITQARRNRTFPSPGPDISFLGATATIVPTLSGIGGSGGGAGGGDGTNAGGGGGAGGPGPAVLEIRAFAIARGAGTAAGALQCLGNVGGAAAAGVGGNAGGGAGGGGSGGGFAYIVAGELTGSTATGAIDVSGGNGGVGAAGVGTGSAAGGGGVAGNGGWAQIINLGIASAPSFTASTANTVPSAAPSGTTGGVAATVQVNL